MSTLVTYFKLSSCFDIKSQVYQTKILCSSPFNNTYCKIIIVRTKWSL